MFRPSTQRWDQKSASSPVWFCVCYSDLSLHHPFPLRICPGVLWTVNDKYKRAESRDLKCGPKERESGQIVFFVNSKQTLGVGRMGTQERPSATRSEAVMTGGIKPDLQLEQRRDIFKSYHSLS